MDKKWTKFWTKNGQKLKLYIQNLMKNYTYTKLLSMLTIFTISIIKKFIN